MWIKCLFLFLISFEAWGYKLTQDFLNGFYWASLPINITVEDSNSTRKTLIQALAKKAVGEWEEKTGFQLWDYTESGTSNIIRWSDNFAAETNMDPVSVLAVAIRYTSGPYFAKTEIVINGSSKYNANADYLYTTITHELGHTMGLDHSEVSTAVMAPTLQQIYYGLQSDDLEAMNDAISKSKERQSSGYISPLSYETTSKSSKPLSCGTIGSPTTGAAWTLNGLFSLVTGLLISFIRKAKRWFKSE